MGEERLFTPILPLSGPEISFIVLPLLLGLSSYVMGTVIVRKFQEVGSVGGWFLQSHLSSGQKVQKT